MNENNYIIDDINDINDVHWLFEYHDIDNNNVFVYDNQFDLFDDYNQNVEIAQNVRFFSFVTKINIDAHNCIHCNNIFTFKNQFFKHLRNACWFFDTFEHVNHDNFIVSHVDHVVSIIILFFRKRIYEFSHVFFSINRRVIQFIVRFDEINSDYVFREYQYDQTIVKLDNNIENIKICIDIDCFVIMIDRKFFIKLLFDVFVQKLISFIFVRNVNDKIVKSNEFMFVNMTFDEMFKSKHEIIDVIEIEMYFIDDFAINMLLVNDVIYSQNIKIDFEKRRFIIIKCENFRLSIDVFNRIISHVKRIIRSC